MKYAHAFLLILFMEAFALTLEAQAQGTGARQLVPSGHRYALLIGVNEYPNETKLLVTLPSAVKDMKDLAAALEEYAGFPRENVILMTDDSPEDLLPTCSNIRTQIEKLRDGLSKDDLLIVAFSGHGVSIDPGDGKEPRPYFCVRDTDLPDTKTLVSRNWIFEQIDYCKADRKILFCDACRTLYTTEKLTQLASRSGKNASIRSLQDSSDTWGFNYILMSSCSKGQNSIDTGENGLFTSFLLEGLRTSKAASVDGDLTAFSWFEYAAKKTELVSEKMIAANPALVVGSESQRQQTPRIECRGEMSRFVIAKLNPAGPVVSISENVEDVQVHEYKVGSLKIQLKPTEQIQLGETIHAGKIQLPPIPEKIGELKGILLGIEDALTRMENGTHEALREAEQAKAAAQAQYEAIKMRRDEAWKKFPPEVQTQLEKQIRESPSDPPTAFASLRPKTIGFSEFIKLVLWGQKTEQALLERERVEKLAAAEIQKEINRMKVDRDKSSAELKQETENFRFKVVAFLLTKSPGWGKEDAKLDYMFLTDTIPSLLKYPFGWEEEDLFALAEKIWKGEALIPDEKAIPVALLRTGDRKVLMVNGVEYAFRWCPPGDFIMGAPESEWPYRPSEFPYDETPHRVKLTKGFWMLETEVTQAMWYSVMGESVETKARQGSFGQDLYGTGDNFPMYYVSWDDCIIFCQRLSRILGQQVKLPTEAQWEYACRAGTTGDYAGNFDSMAWYTSNSGLRTHEVRQKSPNKWGLYDMHGNVWEWCSDYYDETYYSRSPRNDPENTTKSNFHVDRGGAWGSGCCRSAIRHGGKLDMRDADLGFRIILVANPDE